MFTFFKKFPKWGAPKNAENQTFLIFAMMKGALEDVLFWKSLWLSLSFVFILNLLFFVCVYKQVTLLELTLCCYACFIIIDAIEVWLKFKHRTTCLKRLADQGGHKLNATATSFRNWVFNKWSEFVYLRETNHTKAFIMINMILGLALMIGKYLSGYLLCYFLCMLICLLNKIIPPVNKLLRKIQQNAESDMEFDNLIPEVSDVDIKLLSIEPESELIFDERQSLDYWKPNEVSLEEASDSSENSNSLATSLSMGKMQAFDKDVETSDSSEDEYIPIDSHKEQFKSTVEIIEPEATWSSSAYNTLWNITGAVTNMMYTKQPEKRKRVESIDSSDGFEMIDKQDVM